MQHSEIRWAIDRGAVVCGASSMGALRAAELHQFGMIGIGRIFEDYRSGILTRDDEVAIEHGPAELDFPILCEALVNIRPTLARAEALGLVTSQQHQRLVEVAGSMHYPKRTFESLVAIHNVAHPDESVSPSVAKWLTQNRVDQKREDAFQLLSLTGRLTRTPIDHQPAQAFEETEYFMAFRGRFDNPILRLLK
ncbi:TfuA-like protein [Mesorhizobium sp. 10J20-29]